MFESFLHLDFLEMRCTFVLACDGEEIRRSAHRIETVDNADPELVSELAEYEAMIAAVQSACLKHYSLYSANRSAVDALTGNADGRPEADTLRRQMKAIAASKEVSVKYSPKAVHNALHGISYDPTADAQ